MRNIRKFDFSYFWTGFGFLIMGILLSSCSLAQAKTYTVGIVNLAPTLNPVEEGFREKMAELGYVEGENVTYIYDGPVGNIEGLELAVQKLLDENVDLILALSTPAAQAAQKLTGDTQTPVVFVPIFDPVKAGLVENISRPGGNLTGIRWGIGEGRRLEWLLELNPTIERIYIPFNPEDQAPLGSLAVISEVAEKAGVELVTTEVRNPAEISEAFYNFPKDIDAIFFLPDNLIGAQLDEVIIAAKKHKLPLSATSPGHVEQGALQAYGFDMGVSGHQAAQMVNQILAEGVSPAELPVQTTEYVFAINLNTADEIELDISSDILRQADLIIR